METSIDVLRVVGVSLKNGASEALNVNGNITPVTFGAKPATGKKWRIKRIVGYMEGASPFSAEKFGDLPALANGVVAKINGIEIARWKTNRDMVLDMGFIEAPSALAKSDKSLAGEFCFMRAFGEMILVDSLSNGIEIVIGDNLSKIVSFKVKIQGVEV